MTSYRAAHVRVTDNVTLEEAVRETVQHIKNRGGRVVDLKVAPGGVGRPPRAIVLYEIEERSSAAR